MLVAFIQSKGPHNLDSLVPFHLIGGATLDCSLCHLLDLISLEHVLRYVIAGWNWYRRWYQFFRFVKIIAEFHALPLRWRLLAVYL
jgi:hypothetical protein